MITTTQQVAIVQNCDTIITTLKTVQREDAHARTYLGGHFETMLSKYLKPLNRRLIENDISNTSLVENQTKFSSAKSAFVYDYITYQKSLEELVATDCKNNPEDFYEKLVTTRQQRSAVAQDITSLKELTTQHLTITKTLGEQL